MVNINREIFNNVGVALHDKLITHDAMLPKIWVHQLRTRDGLNMIRYGVGDGVIDKVYGKR